MNNGYANNASNDRLKRPFTHAAALGILGGHRRVAAYGHTPSAAANTDCWEGTGLYPFQAAATVLEIVSASANDTAAGTGARTVILLGLDANFNEISETLTLNGVTAVQSVNSYLRVNGVNVASAGTGHVNAGDLTLRVTGAGSTQAIVRAGYGYSKSCIYTVPAGSTLLVTDLLFQCGGVGVSSNITFSFTRISPSGLIMTTNEYVVEPSVPVQRSVIVGAVIPEKTTLTTRITAVTGAGNSGFSSFEGVMMDNVNLA